ncbi:von Willebrand factor A domain-containing protein 5A [Gonapodya sp. JEL0774]|nr:von Willebrand factor A domain-containing protein 5A [Gonapodya sp. JEL0774]
MNSAKICCGLYMVQSGTTVRSVAIPLHNVSVNAEILDCLASVTLSQTYVNEDPNPIEAIYKFPIYESAAVYSFEAEVDGTVIRGVCREREDAAREYNTAIAAGNRAFLLEEQKADIFQISVGNIPSRKPVVIRLSYVHECRTDEDNDELRFTVPTTIASDTYGTFNPPAGTNLLPGGTSYSNAATYTLSVSVDVLMAAGPVSEVSSPTHPIKVSMDGTNPKHAVAKLTLSNVYLDKDFILVVKSPGIDKPRAVLERDSASGTKSCMVTFVPKFRVQEVQTEIIFILDRSGSMQGANIKNARTALILFLKSLPEDCKFNIIGFGSSYRLLFPNSVPYDERNLNTAVKHVESVQADLGGTEIYQPLQEAVSKPVNKNWQRTVIVLTDGEVYQPERIFELATRTTESQNTRIFTLGVGASVSHLLVNGLARAGLGAAEFVGSGERMEGKVVKLIKAGVRGFVRDYKVTWLPQEVITGAETISAIPPSESAPNNPTVTSSTSFFDDDLQDDPLPKREVLPAKVPLVQPAPFRAPPLYAGSRYITFAILDSKLPDPTSVTVSGVSPDGPLEVTIPITTEITVDAGRGVKAVVHTMAARKLVQDLEEGASWMHAEDSAVEESRVRTEVVRLGKSYGIASKFTSYVAVQVLEGAERILTKPPTVIVPSIENQTVAPSLQGNHRSWRGAPIRAPSPVTPASSAGIGMFQLVAAASPARSAGRAFFGASDRSASQATGFAPPSSSIFSKSSSGGSPQMMRLRKASSGSGGNKMNVVSTADDCVVEQADLRMMDTRASEKKKKSSRDASRSGSDDETDEAAVFLGAVQSQSLSKSSSNGSVTSSPEQKLLTLVSMQKFNGSFAAESKLFSLSPKNVQEAPPAGRTAEEWATAVALAVMELVLSAFKDEWELVANKARSWLKKQIGEERSKELVEMAKGQVGA